MPSSLQKSYPLFAPVYDFFIERATAPLRERSLRRLDPACSRVLINGVGTGLDLPFLPRTPAYVGLDFTKAMLARAIHRAARVPQADTLAFFPIEGDAQNLPFENECFDAVILHLILAVVPDPVACLRESVRVLKPKGQILIIDKFLKPNQKAPLRRLFNHLSARVMTRLDVVFEAVFAAVPEIVLIDDRPARMQGWFREICLEKKSSSAHFKLSE